MSEFDDLLDELPETEAMTTQARGNYLEKLADPASMAKFINLMRKVPLEAIDDGALAEAEHAPGWRACRRHQIAREPEARHPVGGIGIDADKTRNLPLHVGDDLPHLGQQIAGIDMVEGQPIPVRAQQMRHGERVLAAAEM